MNMVEIVQWIFLFCLAGGFAFLIYLKDKELVSLRRSHAEAVRRGLEASNRQWKAEQLLARLIVSKASSFEDALEITDLLLKDDSFLGRSKDEMLKKILRHIRWAPNRESGNAGGKRSDD